MAINYTSEFSGQNNDEYDERITSLLNTIQEQQNDILTLNNTITTLSNQITTLANRCSNLEQQESYYTLWTGSWSTQDSQITLNQPYTNYKKIQFFVNDIPSRTPLCDVPLVMYYPEISSSSGWDFNDWGTSLKGTIVKINNTTLKLSYWNYTGIYQTAIVRIVGFKSY